MPASWKLCGSLLVIEQTGVTSNADLSRTMNEALHDARATRGLSVLVDSRESVTAMTTEDVVWRSALLSALVQDGRIARLALVLGPNQRMTAAAASTMPPQLPGLAFAVFSDEAEANAWLSLDDDARPPGP
jgi:stage II sporulation SpoAA-like protein